MAKDKKHKFPETEGYELHYIANRGFRVGNATTRLTYLDLSKPATPGGKADEDSQGGSAEAPLLSVVSLLELPRVVQMDILIEPDKEYEIPVYYVESRKKGGYMKLGSEMSQLEKELALNQIIETIKQNQDEE